VTVYDEARMLLLDMLAADGFRAVGELDPVVTPCVVVRRTNVDIIEPRATVAMDAVAIPGAQLTTGATKAADLYAGDVLDSLRASPVANVTGSTPTVEDYSGQLLWGEAIHVNVHLAL